MPAFPSAVQCFGRGIGGAARADLPALQLPALCGAGADLPPLRSRQHLLCGRVRADPPARVAASSPGALSKYPPRGAASRRPAAPVAERQREDREIVTHQGSPLAVTQCIVRSCHHRSQPTDASPCSPRHCAQSVRRSIAARSVARCYRMDASAALALERIGFPDEWRLRHDLARARGGDPAAASRRGLAHRHARPATAPAPRHRAARARQSGMPALRDCAGLHGRAFVPFIQDTFARYPTLRASRLYHMVRERGYTGSPDHFRHIVARYRPRPAAEAYLRLRTLPGEQGQIDWAHFGKIPIGRARRPLMAFVMVLSYSRHLFVRFYLNAGTASFLDGHVQAFTYFNAVPRTCFTTICAAPCSSARVMRSASIRRCSSSPPGIASSRGRWRWPAATRRAGSSGRSASFASASLPPAALPILPT